MKSIQIILALFLTGSLVLQAENIIFPEDCYYHNGKGGLVLDVTQPPFNAHNDGTHPDETTAALIAAYDMALQAVADLNTSSYIIYLPDGTYLVNNTIIYSEKIRYQNGYHEVLNNIRFQGQSEKKTIIKLTDRAAGFDNKYLAKPVVSFGKGTYNFSVATNQFENITIDAGNNVGATGLLFHGANVASVRHVTIRSSGPDYGKSGLDLPINVAQGIIQNVTIDGFQYGIRMLSDLATHPVFEHITLKNQRDVGFLMGPGSCSIRKMNMDNVPCAIRFLDDKAHLIIIDSEFKNGSPERAAIEFETGNLFARNISAEGYTALIQCECDILYEDLTLKDEYVSGQVLTLFENTPKQTLNLQVEETPEYQWEDDLTQWISVNAFGAVPNDTLDDSKAIQAACNAGKAIVYFLPGLYKLSHPIDIPGHVKAIEFMYSEFYAEPPLKDGEKGAFRVTGKSKHPLFLHEFFTKWHKHHNMPWIEHASKRTLVVRNVVSQRTPFYKNTVEGGKLFIETIHTNRNERSKSRTDMIVHGQKVWARNLDLEHTSGYELVAENSDIWVLGFKTELNQRPKETPKGMFKFSDGCNVEILGGLMNNYRTPVDSAVIYLDIENSNLSYIAREWGLDSQELIFKTVIREKRDNTVHTLDHTATQRRGSEQWNQLIPLFVSKGGK